MANNPQSSKRLRACDYRLFLARLNNKIETVIDVDNRIRPRGEARLMMYMTLFADVRDSVLNFAAAEMEANR